MEGRGPDLADEVGGLAGIAVRAAVLLIGAIVSLGFVAFVGAVILWSRFEAAQLPADQAVRVQPREDLVTVGAIALVVFVLGGFLAVLLLRLLDPNGQATLRTRRGLLVVMLLEIVAAFVVEQWEPWEWWPLAAVVVVGVIALGRLLEFAAEWLGQWPGAPNDADRRPERARPLGEFWDKLKLVFWVGAGFSRVRLWLAAVLLVIALGLLIGIEPPQERYVFAAALGIAAAAVLTLRWRPSSEHPEALRVVIALLQVAGAVVAVAWGGSHWTRFVYAAILLLAAAAELRSRPTSGSERVWWPRLLFGLALLLGPLAVLHWVDPLGPRIVLAAVLTGVGLLTLWAGSDRTATGVWGDLMLQLALVIAAGVVLSHENNWIALVALVALILAGVNLMVAHSTGEGFLRYGVAVFLSVALFGTAFNFIRGLTDPQAQGLAVVRANDTTPICGLYVAETDDRLYYSRVDLQGTANVRELKDDSGRLSWIPRERVDAAKIGPLEPVDKAQSRALDLVQEVSFDREPVRRGADSSPVASRPSRRAGGSDPCGPPLAGTTQRSSADRSLAQRFQPRLHLASDDRFWPVSLLTIFDLEKRGRVLCRKPPCVPVRSQADLPFRGGRSEWLEYPAADDDVRQQSQQIARALGTNDPYRTAREYFLLTRGASRTVSLQYWFFYPFNYQPLRGAGGLKAGFHEGDFEHIGVLLSARDNKPKLVWMARHDEEGQIFLWNEPSLSKEGGHLDVFPAQGSHASYESCLEQARPAAPLGLINDRPECEGSRQIVLEAGEVPLLDLSRARWGCWRGRFGHTRPGISRFEWELYEANGPRSPLWQQDYDGVSARPCDKDLPLPDDLISKGEEPLDERTAGEIRAGAGKLDVLFDECEDWRRPQPQGAYVSACEQTGLTGWLKDGLGANPGPGLRVLTEDEQGGRRGGRLPIAVRRSPESSGVAGWRIQADRSAIIDVYVSCIAGRRPIEATFADVRVEPGANARIDTRGEQWRLTGAVEAEPQAPQLAKGVGDGPGEPRKTPSNTRCG